MGEAGTLSYCELRSKEVVNAIDGRRLGRIIDVVFSAEPDCAEVRGIVVPFVRRLFFSRSQEVFVPWSCIRKIGEDVILVDLVMETGHRSYGKRRRYDAFEDGRFDDYPKAEVHAQSVESASAGEKKPVFSVHADTPKKKDPIPPPPDGPNCDRKCEKCMLFDCAYRWKNL